MPRARARVNFLSYLLALVGTFVKDAKSFCVAFLASFCCCFSPIWLLLFCGQHEITNAADADAADATNAAAADDV